jgi:anti-sigma regulatory factor (Ser/Thr protein kinase)
MRAVEAQPHIVQFYADDDELIGDVSDYLAHAILLGGSAVVIAGAPHRTGLEHAMAAAGVDVRAARRSGSLLVIDAASALAEFMVDGRPDPQRFDASIGAVVRRAARAGRPMRAFGEMVALLWEDGNVNGAIELEELWNELGRQVSFSLFCAYRSDVVGGEDDRRSLEAVCHLHSKVVGDVPPERTGVIVLRDERDGSATAARGSFAADALSPRAARQFVAETLERWGRTAVVDDAALVITELATNAVVHARSGFTVALARDGATIRISVRDDTVVPPAPRDAPLLASSGRGLAMVAVLAERWGTEVLPDGKVVWADLDR